MSVREWRIARRKHHASSRRAGLDRLGQGHRLRAAPGWAAVIQALAFFRKELAEIVRQPKLLVLLVLGPFALLLVFGAGYQDAAIRLRTGFVGPAGSVYEQAVTDYTDQLDEYIEPMGFTSDEAAAMQRLHDDELDAVVVFPVDALEQIRNGRSATIEVRHEKLDPFQQAAIDIASRLAVQEVNASVLSAVAGGAQTALTPVDQASSALTEHADALTALVTADDPAAISQTANAAAATLGDVRLVVAASQGVLARLGGDGEEVDAADDLLARLDAAAADAAAAGQTQDTDQGPQATALASALTAIATTLDAAVAVDPAVLVRPFEADTQNIAPIDIEPVDFFAPSSIVLLLQHLALTFAALSLVRDRQLGLFELLRVGPLSSVEILVGKTVAYMTVGVVVGAVLVGAAVLVLGVPLEGRVAWIAVAVLLVVLASLAMGMVLSMISGSETQAVQYAMLSLLAAMFFSGFILDVDQLATPYRYLSYLLPVTYGIDMLHDVMLRGVTPASADLIGVGALVVTYGSLAILLLHRRLRTE